MATTLIRLSSRHGLLNSSSSSSNIMLSRVLLAMRLVQQMRLHLRQHLRLSSLRPHLLLEGNEGNLCERQYIFVVLVFVSS